ncbi:cytochrome c oxidase subunit 3 [Sinorhizobium medicae]|uniref:cytochrome c oxidase subunit 3 n=2 Tax=Sinorhizobium medicae TaxID=110321 RepID=UPI000C7A675F|nr:cytochrome c oxidase subunit 3 [Sinorhizobium medicae]MDX0518974.1 cytochrome C oxidase subunit III [Sinorhizobium medicae]MDX0729418.1 cytochrome C oxidase subunit III [Sinorhizobium medicae]MDX0735606.1 cytochrome C oxidase subunit III [Sinorhizobium medicae]MDX0815616.1 cytochrome C oxidase subunit III [Sinorhizobium medicae]MDX1103714.1 cytochrome C oxidase subunit III [Sinorhizobium medicae]
MEHRVVRDLAELPSYAFGPRMTMWWGTLAFCVLEGTGFALALGGYLFLAFINPDWPLGPPPPLLWSGIFTILMLASLVPNFLTESAAREENLSRVRILLVVMSGIGVLLTGVRIMEFAVLPVRWDFNAYGSLLWAILGLHAAHLVTDIVDTVIVTVLMFTRHGFGRRFSDVEDNAFYWNFVVLSWLPTYFVLYWVPRL